jgi:hypothetical protein
MTLPATGASEVFSLEPQYPASCMSMVELVFLRSLQLMKKEKVFEMKLTKEEKKMRDGDEGSAKQKAMELIVRYGNVIGAEALCSVTWADLFCGSHAYLDVLGSGDFDEVFSRMSLCATELVTLESMAATCVCFSGVEPDCTEVPDELLMSTPKKDRNLNFLFRFIDAGVVLSGNCIPSSTWPTDAAIPTRFRKPVQLS